MDMYALDVVALPQAIVLRAREAASLLHPFAATAWSAILWITLDMAVVDNFWGSAPSAPRDALRMYQKLAFNVPNVLKQKLQK